MKGLATNVPMLPWYPSTLLVHDSRTVKNLLRRDKVNSKGSTVNVEARQFAKS
jgi:hypothetical protein